MTSCSHFIETHSRYVKWDQLEVPCLPFNCTINQKPRHLALALALALALEPGQCSDLPGSSFPGYGGIKPHALHQSSNFANLGLKNDRGTRADCPLPFFIVDSELMTQPAAPLLVLSSLIFGKLWVSFLSWMACLALQSWSRGLVRLDNIPPGGQGSPSERTLFSFPGSLNAPLKLEGMTSQHNKVAKTYSTKMSSHGYIFCKLQRLEYKSE